MQKIHEPTPQYFSGPLGVVDSTLNTSTFENPML